MRDAADCIADELEKLYSRSELVGRICFPSSKSDRYEAIRAFYVKVWPEVRDTPTHQWAIDPYEVDWPALFTPIERSLWGDIREEGMVLYPQHPVAGYFVDFGHPKARVAIECDGAAYHMDRAKDAARERAILAKGWAIYRFTGRECMQDFVEVEDWNTATRFIPSETRQRLRAIARAHGLSSKHLGAA